MIVMSDVLHPSFVNSVCVFCLKHLQTSQKNVLFRCLKKKQTSLHSKKRNLFGSANFLDSIADSMPITLKLYSRRDLPLSKRDWIEFSSAKYSNNC